MRDTTLQTTRRTFLSGTLAALSLGWAPARAQSTDGPRFLVVQASGGWDPLAVFAPLYDTRSVDMEPGTDRLSIGNLSLVDGPGRPAARSFFERHYRRTLILDGVAARSVNHETCSAVVLTGGTSDDRPDFTTLLAHGARDRYDLPHIAISGPVFPGEYGVLVSRAQGALSPLVRGDLAAQAVPAVGRLPEAVGRRVDHFVEQRVQAVLQGHPESPHARDLAEGWSRARRLIDDSANFDIQFSPTLAGRAETAIGALADGLCRCATIDTGFVWDTHIDNSDQAPQFQSLFAALDQIVDRLDTTPGPSGAPLSSDTVLVVLSEMARTPIYNGTGGRDHWPFTTMMLLGPGLKGDLQAGGYTPDFRGIGIDPTSGQLDPSRAGISTADIAATLLALGGMDPGAFLPGSQPLTGLFA
ncbi:MAG: DUF1501 domain-containing protein [Myxococcota bacterium]